ncbi:hypothetical protein [Aquibacillus albus]|uniref:Malate synthase n=1 Tax=Aquibacillus albus TaxID=1168171 RepID=A0ABS2N684_9BACI|nr:hypothetical protein [Aquibacillus albus]MBM7573650.1 malate synthase [Aquibacillus albus]
MIRISEERETEYAELRLKETKRELKKNRWERERLLDDLIEGKIDQYSDSFRQRRDELNASRDELEANITKWETKNREVIQ